ncbi:alpha/beta hydrolase [Streptomyces rubiginosohelvolus]|uniref:alpha/beta hydrolase n=1 Tax=Streptomyces rubiginosohelvolus TaxID=67362 RepID=UPI003719192E
MTAPPTLLLVHGAWHGGWCWSKLQSALETEGVESRTLDLPSAGRPSGVAEDADAIRRAISEIEGPVVVVAHSYGGIPASQAVDKSDGVVKLVYLAAFQLDAGESLLGYVDAPVPSEEHEMQPVPDDPFSLFYADVSHEEAEEAATRLKPQSAKSFSDVVTRAGWHDVPSTYIICEQDQALPVALQEALATRAAESYRMAGSHSPFLANPEELATLLTKITSQSLT